MLEKIKFEGLLLGIEFKTNFDEPIKDDRDLYVGSPKVNLFEDRVRLIEEANNDQNFEPFCGIWND